MSDSLLWLDDEPESVSAIAREITQRLSIQVVVVPSIEDFLVELETKKYFLVLIDIGVPLADHVEYPEEFLSLVNNKKYAGSAALAYALTKRTILGNPRVFACTGHAPEFVDATLHDKLAYQYVNKSMIMLGPNSFIAELGIGRTSSDHKKSQLPPTKTLSDDDLHDIRLRLLQSASVIASITQSAARMLGVGTASNGGGNFDFEAAIRSQFNQINELLEGIDAYDHPDFIDSIDDLLLTARSAEEKGYVVSQSMIVAAVFSGFEVCRRTKLPAALEVGEHLNIVLHLLNYAAIAQQANHLQYTASLLGVPQKPDDQTATIVSIIEEECLGLQPEASSRNLEIQPDLKVNANVEQEHVNRFRSAFYNILKNAVKYNADTGRKRTWVDVRTMKHDNFIVTEVESWGERLAEEDYKFIIERGYRGKNARALGFGLGLGIANEHMEAIGGELDVQIREVKRGRSDRVMFCVALKIPVN